MASVLYLTATTTIVQLETRAEMHGRVLALQMVLMAGTAPVGGPLMGWVADTLGGRAPIVLGGIVCLAAAVFGFFASRRTGHRAAAQG
jgi:MFS family permease